MCDRLAREQLRHKTVPAASPKLHTIIGAAPLTAANHGGSPPLLRHSQKSSQATYRSDVGPAMATTRSHSFQMLQSLTAPNTCPATPSLAAASTPTRLSPQSGALAQLSVSFLAEQQAQLGGTYMTKDCAAQTDVTPRHREGYQHQYDTLRTYCS